MTWRHLAFAPLALALGVPAPALARAWQGITPGTSSQADVVARFGEPSTKGRLEGRAMLVYKSDQAIAGTRQAQFVVADDGTVSEVNVFPSTQLDKESVEGTYGKPTQKTFTDDFRPVWMYRNLGVWVFFGKDGFVEAIRFRIPEGAGAAPRPPAAPQPPAAQPPPPAQAPAAARPGPPESER